MSDRVLRFPDRTWDQLEALPQPLRNAAHQAIFHLLQEPVPTLADPFPEDDLTANQVSLWYALRVAGAQVGIDDYGQLFNRPCDL